MADADSAGRTREARAASGPDATHHCGAFRVWRAGRIEEAGFDAGEPGGTAGRPILGALRHAGLLQAACVVSRWFGGVKLGTGGLVRAYAEAAEAAVAAAREAGVLVAAEERARLRPCFDYPLSGAVQRMAARFQARDGGGVRRAGRARARRRGDSADAFERALGEATGGAIESARLESRIEPH